MRRIGFQLLGRAVQSRSVATKAPAATGKFTEAIKVAQLAQLGSKDVAALTAANNSEKHDSVALTEAVWRLKVMQGLSSVSTASLSMLASRDLCCPTTCWPHPVQAPLRMHDTAGKYAHAVYSAARKQGVAAKVEADLKAIAALMEVTRAAVANSSHAHTQPPCSVSANKKACAPG